MAVIPRLILFGVLRFTVSINLMAQNWAGHHSLLIHWHDATQRPDESGLTNVLNTSILIG